MASQAPTATLHERARELARIAGRLAETRAGDGSLTVIEGPAGIGKTSLLKEALAQAERAGMQTLTGQGFELERDFAFGVLRQVLERPLAELDDVDREAVTAGGAEHALPLLDPARAAAGSESLFHGFYWLVANLAERRPVVLGVDDAQWADESSVLALAYLARRVAQLPVAIFVCTRPPNAESRSALSALVADGAAERLLPDSLGAEGVSAIAGSDAPEFVEAALRVTGGNPFLLQQLLLELDGDRRAEAVARIEPRDLGRQVLVRVSDGARNFALALSVLGERSSPSECAMLAGLDASESIDELVAAGVLADEPELRFRHPLIAAAVTAGLSPARRTQWHAEAARLLDERGGDIERQAIHLAACPPGGNPGVAKVLSEAAERALARGAPIEAAPLLRRALDEPPAAADRPQLLLARGEALAMAGDPEAAAMFAAAARTSEDPEVKATALEARGWWWALEPGADVPDLAAIDALLAALPDGAEDLRNRVEAVRIAVASRSGPEMRDALARIERLGLLSADRKPDPNLLATIALWCVPVAEASVDYALRAVQAAARQQLSLKLSFWAPFAFRVLLAGDRHEDARRVAASQQVLARENGSPTWFGLATNLQALQLLAAGDLREAEGEAATAAAAVADTSGWMNPYTRATLVDVLVARGRRVEADDQWRRLGLPDAIPEAFPMSVVLLIRARLRRAGGDVRGALADLHEVERRFRELGRPSMNDQEARLLTAQIEHSAGNDEIAEGLADQGLAIAERWGTTGAIGEAQRVSGVIRSDIELLRSAAEHLAESPLRLSHAKALGDLGGLLRRQGARRNARGPLLEGLELARECGADGLAERLGEELAATGATVPRRAERAGDALTPSERRIARMAAGGASNKEIAQELFLSVKTIEMHLGHTYRKLDISSRRDLTTALPAGPE